MEPLSYVDQLGRRHEKPVIVSREIADRRIDQQNTRNRHPILPYQFRPRSYRRIAWSENEKDPIRYVIPQGAVVEPNGYVVFYENPDARLSQ